MARKPLDNRILIYVRSADVSRGAICIGECEMRLDGHYRIVFDMRTKNRCHAASNTLAGIHCRQIMRIPEQRVVSVGMQNLVRSRIADRRNGYATRHLSGRKAGQRPQRQMAAGRAAAYPYLVVRQGKTLFECGRQEKLRRFHTIVPACRPSVGRRRKTVFDVERDKSKALRKKSGNTLPAGAIATRPSATVYRQHDRSI